MRCLGIITAVRLPLTGAAGQGRHARRPSGVRSPKSVAGVLRPAVAGYYGPPWLGYYTPPWL